MKLRLIRTGALITLYNGIYAIFYGILIFVFKNIILTEYFSKVPVPWHIFSRSFPKRADLYYSLLITNAFFLIVFGIFIIYMSYFILKRKDKLAWVVLFFAGIFGWASLFIINFMKGSWFMTIASFIGWGSFVIGMILPIGYYLRKEYPGFL